ncbi:baseplate J/gp47 family protein [Calidithermus chliarophilus]|uniref:baseplate J/gp47 family protein n=1 Tax=Calidithermus chliarophilus TaxID=52023 RepID=UPI00040C4096|nr:baseplate J/gp47 family protein [Calidithermus chliarophilus]
MSAPYTFKTLDEATWEMLALFWGLSGIQPDSEPGSVLRTLFEAVGFEVEDLTWRFDQAARAAIPQAVFEAFGFEPEGARSAQAQVTFYRAAPLPTPLVIPQGFRVARVDGTEYATTAEAQIGAGFAEATVPVAAVIPGEAGNCPAGAIVVPRGALPGLQRITNLLPATGGRDQESLEDQKARFARYIALIHRATPAALEAAALAAAGPNGERAKEVLVLDALKVPTMLPGDVEVFVDDGTGNAPESLVQAVRLAIAEVRAAGTRVTVSRVGAKAVDVSGAVTAPPEALEPAREAVRAYFRGLRVGQKFDKDALLVAIKTAHPLVDNVSVTQPVDDVLAGPTQRIVLGTLDLSRV